MVSNHGLRESTAMVPIDGDGADVRTRAETVESYDIDGSGVPRRGTLGVATP